MKLKNLLYQVMIFSLLTTGSVVAQNEAVTDENKIKETALNYGDGFLSGSGERMEKALFPDLQKLAPMELPNGGGIVFIQSTYSGLIAMSAAKLGVIAEEERQIEVEALAVHKDIACAKLRSTQFNDYLHMVKVGEDWKIVNVLWTWGSASRNRNQVPQLDFEGEQSSITEVVRKFHEGIFTGNKQMVAESMIPRFSQASWNALPNGDKMIGRDGADLLQGIAAGKLSLVPEESWNLEINILDYMDGLASVQVSSVLGYEFVHLVYVDGAWKIVNILKLNER